MTTGNVQKGSVRLIETILYLAVIIFLVLTILLASNKTTCVVYKGELLVERRVSYHQSVVVQLQEKTSEGDVEVRELRLYLEGNERNYRYAPDHFQKLLETSNEVEIIGSSSKFLDALDGYSSGIQIMWYICAALTAVAALYVAICTIKILLDWRANK